MRNFLSLIVIILITYSAKAQQEPKPYTLMVGLSWNAIDDDGSPYKNLIDFGTRWNMLPIPTSVSFDYYLANGMSVESISSFNRFIGSNIVNTKRNESGIIFNTDLNFKFSFGYLTRKPYFDPFIFVGASYTMRPIARIETMFSPNIGAGINIMFSETIGIQLRTAAKIAVYPVIYKHESNYLHHHAGIIYRFGSQNYSGRFRGKKYGWTKKKRYKFR
jgi:hypothetical protein